MNNKEFLAELASKCGYTQQDTQKLVRTVIEEMGARFEDGDALSVPAFGSFEVKKRLERIVVNPSTGRRMLVPPKLVLNFKPATAIKEELKNGGLEA
ncbi:HU family DNA-binding protein [Prevotella sp. kh1p2]|uniref:HU family DNA-binding protein n=1 Tax=Prevotella sp. kh1p2 TaxID=1761883 RepID=UPI0008C91CD6|nr:HU family DNA-binding protein [Prevotella sp. kh1p2]SET04357.1 DNA-binding protein HU-beta [Prevotella sp. kh1p2]SNU11713.1 DNA-binding protein HU-beta [Prevotellaceae bacterium KH2P17]